MMNLHYTENSEPILNKTFSESTANMLLFGEIGVDLDAEMFIREMTFLKSIGMDIVVKINSPGGKVFDGYAIMEAIEDNGADTYIVGLAASMAGVISQAGKKRFANRRAVLMVHSPAKGKEDLIEKVRASLTRELAAKSNMDTAEIEALVSSDSGDTFFDISEMLEKGLIDQVIESGVPIDDQFILNKSTKEIYEVFNSILNKIDYDMKSITNALGLPENKTEAEVVNTIEGINTQLTEAQNKVTELEADKAADSAKITELENNISEGIKAKATTLVEAAVEAGKIKEEVKESWTAQAIENFDLAKTTLDSIGTIKTKAVSIAGGVEDGATEKDYLWLAKNDPKTLNKIATEQPEKFAKLESAYQEKVRKN